MRKFSGNDFLLTNDLARLLYHNYAQRLPIIDCTCSLNVREIAKDQKFDNITTFLLDDCNKKRVMRAAGVLEKYISGDASDYEKFREFARIMPSLIGNPIYPLTCLELRRFFGLELLLSPATCDIIWSLANKRLEGMSVKSILKSSKVKSLCISADANDTLEFYKETNSDFDFGVKVLPSFNPDKALNIGKRGIRDYLKLLGDGQGIEIVTFRDLENALSKSLDRFEGVGLKSCVHRFDGSFRFDCADSLYELDNILKKAVMSDGAALTENELTRFKGSLLLFLAFEYKKRSLVMQLQPVSASFDLNGSCVRELTKMLTSLSMQGKLPRTAVYFEDPLSINTFGALSDTIKASSNGMPTLMHGITLNTFNFKEQLQVLAGSLPFTNLIGINTASCGALSLVKHDYSRRVLCDYLGSVIERGEYPCDFAALANIVMDVCYNNQKNYFGFKI